MSEEDPLRAAVKAVYEIQEMTPEQERAWANGLGMTMPDGSTPDELNLMVLLPVWWRNVAQNGQRGTYTGLEWSTEIGPTWLEGRRRDPKTGKTTRLAWWPPSDLESCAEYV